MVWPSEVVTTSSGVTSQATFPGRRHFDLRGQRAGQIRKDPKCQKQRSFHKERPFHWQRLLVQVLLRHSWLAERARL